MKQLIFVIIPLIVMGCSSSENTATNDNIQIINAKFNNWSEPPPGNSDVPERGTDLSVTVKNWSDDFAPEYIIYKERKTRSATISDTVDGNPVITGRIVRSSSKLTETSETVAQSDRLVYSDEQGETGFVEIENWQSP